MFNNLRQGRLSLDDLSIQEVKLYLPVLCRTISFSDDRKRTSILSTLHDLHHDVFDMLRLLQCDLSEVIEDAMKEHKLRQKTTSRREDSALLHGTQTQLNEVFAGSNIESKVRMVASEFIYLQHTVLSSNTTSELLICEDYKDYVSYIICILCYRIPEVFNVISIISMLIHLPDSKYYIDVLVLNHPERYEQFVQHFIGLFTATNKPFQETRILHHLEMMIGLSDESRYTVCLPLIQNVRKRLMIASILDKTSFEENLDIIISSLVTSTETTSFVDFVRTESKASEKIIRFSDLRDKLFEVLSTVVKRRITTSTTDSGSLEKPKDEDSFYCSFLDETIQEDLRKATEDVTDRDVIPDVLRRDQVQRTSSLLILYLKLINTTRMTLTASEASEWLFLISHQPRPDVPEHEAELLVRLSLALVLSSTSLHLAPNGDASVRKWLTDMLQSLESNTGKGRDLFMSVGMHLHSGSYELIGPLLSDSLGITIKVTTGHAAKIQKLWSAIHNEEQIVTLSGKIPVVMNLSGDISGYLPIHCISQILNSRTPSCPPALFTWLPRQLREAREPVHGALCELINGGVKYLMSAKGRSAGITGMSEESIATLLTEDKNITCRVLTFYYLLLYRNGLAELKQKNESQRGAAPLPPNYPAELLGEDNAKTFLLHTKRKREAYTAIYPVFLRLLITQFPYLCESQDLLLEEEAAENISKLSQNDQNFKVTSYLENIYSALVSRQEPKAFYLITQMLRRYHPYIPAEIVARCIPHVARLSFRLQNVFTKLWEKSAALSPQKTWLHSVHVLISDTISERDLWSNPLLLFRMPKDITATTVGIRLLLHMIRGYLSLCSARITEVDAVNPRKSKEHQDNQTLFLTLQNSAVVQVLLDLCEMEEGERAGEGSGDGRSIDASTQHEINALIYNFIHDFFIKNDGLSKLVCWQTFKFSQVEGVVNGIPSIHVASKFAVPLLQQGSLQKQLFSTCLLSHLAVQYPIPQTLGSCTEMLQWALTQNSELSTVWTILSIPSLLRIANIFPPLVDKITQLLAIQRKLVKALDMKSLMAKIRMYSETEESLKPAAALDTAFEELATLVLARMKGT